MLSPVRLSVRLSVTRVDQSKTVEVAIMQYDDLLAGNCKFFLPHSLLTPSLEVNPFEFLDELFIAKTRVLGPF